MVGDLIILTSDVTYPRHIGGWVTVTVGTVGLIVAEGVDANFTHVLLDGYVITADVDRLYRKAMILASGVT